MAGERLGSEFALRFQSVESIRNGRELGKLWCWTGLAWKQEMRTSATEVYMKVTRSKSICSSSTDSNRDSIYTQSVTGSWYSSKDATGRRKAPP